MGLGKIIIVVSKIYESRGLEVKTYYMNNCPMEAEDNPEEFFTDLFSRRTGTSVVQPKSVRNEPMSRDRVKVTVLKVDNINENFTQSELIQEYVDDYLMRKKKREEWERESEITELKKLLQKYPDITTE